MNVNYHCKQCNDTGRLIFWQCPSCHGDPKKRFYELHPNFTPSGQGTDSSIIDQIKPARNYGLTDRILEI